MRSCGPESALGFGSTFSTVTGSSLILKPQLRKVSLRHHPHPRPFSPREKGENSLSLRERVGVRGRLIQCGFTVSFESAAEESRLIACCTHFELVKPTRGHGVPTLQLRAFSPLALRLKERRYVASLPRERHRWQTGPQDSPIALRHQSIIANREYAAICF